MRLVIHLQSEKEKIWRAQSTVTVVSKLSKFAYKRGLWEVRFHRDKVVSHCKWRYKSETNMQTMRWSCCNQKRKIIKTILYMALPLDLIWARAKWYPPPPLSRSRSQWNRVIICRFSKCLSLSPYTTLSKRGQVCSCTVNVPGEVALCPQTSQQHSPHSDEWRSQCPGIPCL